MHYFKYLAFISDDVLFLMWKKLTLSCMRQNYIKRKDVCNIRNCQKNFWNLPTTRMQYSQSNWNIEPYSAVVCFSRYQTKLIRPYGNDVDISCIKRTDFKPKNLLTIARVWNWPCNIESTCSQRFASLPTTMSILQVLSTTISRSRCSCNICSYHCSGKCSADHNSKWSSTACCVKCISRYGSLLVPQC